MRAKPKGAKYRNLYVWRGTIWYGRTVGGRRFRHDTNRTDTPEGWREAALYRDKYEAAKGIGRPGARLGQVPTFAALVTRYFESQKFSQLAATSQQDRRSHLGPNGPVAGVLGSKRVDEITADTLVDWWEATARERDWSVQTGFRHISTIAEVLKQGRRYLSGPLPTIEARERIGEQRKTAAGRAGSGPQCRPIEDPAAIQRLVDTVQESESLQATAFVLSLLDAGLRKGEALALRWRHVAWGADENDPRRHLVIEASRSRHSTEDGATKSGHTRRVGLSRRLHGALGKLYLDRPPKDLGDRIFSEIEGETFRATWRGIVGRADLPGVRIKDLRDTFASQLLTVGIPIQWVSRQIGHSGVSVTERHYAKYLGIGGDEFVYVEPLRLEPGEIPADLLSRLEDCSQSAHKDDPFTIPAFLQSAESSRNRSSFPVDFPPEAIVTLVRATDFKSVGGCGDTASAGSIPVRFRHFSCEDAPSPLLPQPPASRELPPKSRPVG